MDVGVRHVQEEDAHILLNAGSPVKWKDVIVTVRDTTLDGSRMSISLTTAKADANIGVEHPRYFYFHNAPIPRMFCPVSLTLRVAHGIGALVAGTERDSA